MTDPTPRPIHRWKSFWLGVLIITFLTWAWSRSRTHEDHLSIRPTAHTWYGVTISNGYLCSDIRTVPVSYANSNRITYHCTTSITTRPWIQNPPENTRTSSAAMTTSLRRIAPLWTLTFLFPLAWSALLLWRSSRMRKAPHLAKPTAETTPP